jgi:hypothetical protein
MVGRKDKHVYPKRLAQSPFIMDFKFCLVEISTHFIDPVIEPSNNSDNTID